MTQLPGVIWTTDREARVTSIGGGGLRLIERIPADLVGRRVEDLTRELGIAPELPLLHRRALAGEPVRAEIGFMGRNYEIRITPLVDQEGIVGTVGAAMEATERKRAEEETANLARRLAHAEKVAQVGSWEWDTATDRMVWSDQLHRLHGLQPGEFEGTYLAFIRVVHPEDRKRIGEEIAEVVRSPRPFAFEHRILWPDGTERVLSVRGEAVLGPNGSPRLVGACHDITEIRKANEQRELAHSLLRSTLESTADGILVVDRAGKIVSYNQRFVEMWRIPPEIVASSDDAAALKFVLSQLTDPEQFERRVRELYSSPELDSFDVLEFKDGRIFERLSRPQRLGNQIMGRVWSFRDATELRRTLLARDEFLAIASHEFRTPLATLVLMIRVLQRDLEESGATTPSMRRHLAAVQRQADRLSVLSREIVEVTRLHAGPLQLELEPVDLVEVVREVARRFESQLRSGEYELRVRESGPVVGNWDRARLIQIATQLLSNAIRYGRGKPIELAVERFGEIARLTVSDRGIGIDPRRLPFIFKEFERAVSSRHYGGLGLGLYIASSLVERFGGIIRAQSEPGVGSTFVVELPPRPPPSTRGG